MWYYNNSSKYDIQMNKWNNQMTHGVCGCVCCMCSVLRVGMCERNPIRIVIHLMVWRNSGIENIMLLTADTQLSTLKAGN